MAINGHQTKLKLKLTKSQNKQHRRDDFTQYIMVHVSMSVTLSSLLSLTGWFLRVRVRVNPNPNPNSTDINIISSLVTLGGITCICITRIRPLRRHFGDTDFRVALTLERRNSRKLKRDAPDGSLL